MKKIKILPLLAIAFLAIAPLFSSCSNNHDEIIDDLPPNTMFVQSRAYAMAQRKISGDYA